MKLSRLNEQPMTTYSTKEGLWRYFEKLMNEQNITLSMFDKTDHSDIYRYDSVTASLYIHYTVKDGVTAYMCFTQNAINHKGKIYPVIQQKKTLNYKNIFNNFTLEIFKNMNKTYKRPILSDDENSHAMQSVFVRWLNNPEKYGLKNFFIYDSKTKKTYHDSTEVGENIWSDFESGKRYTLVFDFFDYLKEDTKMAELNDSFKGAGGVLSRLYYSGPTNTPPEVTFY